MIRATLLLCFAPLLFAQTAAPPRTVHATGTASITIKPDQAKFHVGVITQAKTAQEAAAQNATLADAVTSKLQSVLTGRGSIQTISYSISPTYNSAVNQPPQLTGYMANNVIQVTCNDLSVIGPLIDAASQAGANTVDALQFTLQNPEPAKQQALAAAAKQARAHADAIATGIGGTTGRVISASEASMVAPIFSSVATGAGAATPITTGTLDVSATVTVDVELQ
jgi:uncharacterized protein YggE